MRILVANQAAIPHVNAGSCSPKRPPEAWTVGSDPTWAQPGRYGGHLVFIADTRGGAYLVDASLPQYASARLGLALAPLAARLDRPLPKPSSGTPGTPGTPGISGTAEAEGTDGGGPDWAGPGGSGGGGVVVTLDRGRGAACYQPFDDRGAYRRAPDWCRYERRYARMAGELIRRLRHQA